jgi:hypothetical protein
MSPPESLLPAPDWWDRLIRYYEARQAGVTGWPELPDYIRLLRQVAASPYATLVRPWQFLDLLVLARDGDGPPRATTDTVQVAPGRQVQIARMRGNPAKQVTVEQVTCGYSDAWQHLQVQLSRLLNDVEPFAAADEPRESVGRRAPDPG